MYQQNIFHRIFTSFFAWLLIAAFFLTPFSAYGQIVVSERTISNTNLGSEPTTKQTEPTAELETDQTVQEPQDQDSIDTEPTPDNEPDSDNDKENQEDNRNEDEETTVPRTIETNLGLDKYSVQSGAFVYPFDIALPEGINGLTPDLSLIYNSNNYINYSPYASGWSDNIPYIETLNKKGVNSMYTDSYYASSLDGELVVSSGDEYVPRVENGSFNKYEKLNNGWKVTTKDGTVYLFGTATSSQQYDPADPTRVAKWMLESVTDTNGNTIDYTYVTDQNYIYPDIISYVDGFFEVKFLREDRGDIIKKYDKGFPVQRNSRISEIQVLEDGEWVYRYDLNYGERDPITKQSQLSNVIISSKDKDGFITFLPQEQFDYAVGEKTWRDDNHTYSIPTRLDGPGSEFGIYSSSNGGRNFFEINGDGLPDFIRVYNSNSVIDYNANAVFINNGSGWDYRPEIEVPNINNVAHAPFSGLNGFPIDINGDSIIDFLAHDQGEFLGTRKCTVYIGNGQGWTATTTQWALSSRQNNQGNTVCGHYNYVETGYSTVKDVNADMLPDVVHATVESPEFAMVRFNDSQKWNLDEQWDQFPSVPYYGGELVLGLHAWKDTRDFFDVNGDNLPDFINIKDGGWGNDDRPLYRNAIFINNGSNGWERYGDWEFPFWQNQSNGQFYEAIDLQRDESIRADVNNDGLIDFLMIHHNGNAQDSERSSNTVYLNTGIGWVKDSEYIFPFDENGNALIHPYITDEQYATTHRDINGDGLIDFMNVYESAHPDNYSNGIYLSQGKLPLLKTITNSASGTIEIGYEPAAQVDENYRIPFAQQVVTSVELDDGVGNSWTETYEYDGGEYYFNGPFDKKQAGFETITKTDGEGNKTISYYHQADGESVDEPSDSYGKIGREYKTEIFDDQDNLFSRSITLFDEQLVTGSSTFVFADSVLTQQFDGTGSHTDTASAYEYDDYGNVETEIHYGTVDGSIDGTFSDTGSDKRSVVREYSNMITDYIVGLVTKETIKDNGNQKKAETKYYYDDLGHGEVSEGNLTTVSRWIKQSDYSDINYTHNDNGQVLTETDPLDNTTTHEYGPHSLYPATTTNELGHVTTYEYNYSSGQPTVINAPNGNTTTITYDGFDRPLETKQTINGNLVLVSEQSYDDLSIPQIKQETIHYSDTHAQDRYTYTDGFGRTVQTKQQADLEGSAGYITNDLTYDEAGRVKKQSLPYTTTAASYEEATTDSDLWTTFNYDPLDRQTEITTALGTTSFDYDGFTTTITDAEENTKDLVNDAFGNLIEVHEHNNSDEYITEYEYDVLGNLTKITDAQGFERSLGYDGLSRRTHIEELHAPGSASGGNTGGVGGIIGGFLGQLVNTGGTTGSLGGGTPRWTYLYDDLNLTGYSDPTGNIISYIYDDLNRVLTEDSDSTSGVDWTFTYDSCLNGIGMQCSAVGDNGVTTTNSYLSQGTLASTTKTILGQSFITEYTYDRVGNIETTSYPGSETITNNYNTQGQLESVHNTIGHIATFEYGPHGRVTKQTHENGAVTDYVYDAERAYELTEKNTNNDGVEIQKLAYVYDNVGTIKEKSNLSDNETATYIVYDYDDLYRLSSVTTHAAANGDKYYKTYEYSPIGNITNFDGVSYTYARTGNANPHAVTSIGSNVFVYDKNGNLTADNTWNHTWNYQNTLSSSTNGSSTSTYLYDYDKSRLALTENEDTTLYPNSNFQISSSGAKIDVTNAGSLVATLGDSASSTEHIHTDHLGSPHVITDTQGDISNLKDYYPFGSVRIDEGSSNEDNGFTGYELDQDTGLNYAEARYYNSATGRFISQDTAVLRLSQNQKEQAQLLTDPQQLNTYSYVRNNPLKHTDPTGEILPLVGIAAYAAFEVAFTAYDAYHYGKTLTDENSTGRDLGFSGGGLLLGLALPGGGYGKAATEVVDRSESFLTQFMKSDDAFLKGSVSRVNLSADRLQHIQNRHLIGGSNVRPGKGLFNNANDIEGLVSRAKGQPIIEQANGNYKMIYDAGREVGTHGATGEATSMVTVITNKKGDVVTAFPSKPKKD